MKPTPRQLNYLRSLAERTGQTFAWPKTAAEASAEIRRLEGAKKTPLADRRREHREVRDDMATGRGDAARVRADELSGYGSTARWVGDSDGRPKPAVATKPKVGERVELGRYTITSGERVLYGQRVDGVVRVTDKPARGRGRSLLVERGLTSHRELQAVVADYIAESQRRDEPAAIVRVGNELAGLTA